MGTTFSICNMPWCFLPQSAFVSPSALLAALGKDEFWGLISDLFIFGRSHHSVPAYLPHFLFEVLLRFEAARPVVGSGANRCASVGAGSGSERSKD
jgi:hypothetical protein